MGGVPAQIAAGLQGRGNALDLVFGGKIIGREVKDVDQITRVGPRMNFVECQGRSLVPLLLVHDGAVVEGMFR